MRLSELVAVAPPPRDPVAGRGDWGIVQQWLGLGLPEDFKALIETYGLGSFADFLNPINPFQEGGSGFEWADRNILEFDRETRREYPDELPYSVHPEPGGILPWATTDNGDILYWLTEGEPDSWSILIRQSRGPNRVAYPFGVAEFLHLWLIGELICPIFPRWDVHSGPGFSPARERRSITVYFSHVDGTFDERLGLLMNHFGASDAMRRSSPRQCIFWVSPSETKVTYTDTGSGYEAWLATLFSPHDEWYFKEIIQAISTQLGWPIREISGSLGQPWADGIIATKSENSG